jgi:hypothetical protein
LVSPTLSWVFELFEKEVRVRARMEAEWEWDVLRRFVALPVSSDVGWLSFVCCFTSIDDVHPLPLVLRLCVPSHLDRKTIHPNKRFWTRIEIALHPPGHLLPFELEAVQDVLNFP